MSDLVSVDDFVAVVATVDMHSGAEPRRPAEQGSSTCDED